MAISSFDTKLRLINGYSQKEIGELDHPSTISIDKDKPITLYREEMIQYGQ
jgi:hypothetical protein